MNRSWLSGVLGGVAVGVATLAVTGALRAQGTPPAAVRVASVDVGRIFGEYQRMKDVSEELRALEQRLNTENEQRKQQLDALQATVDAMDRNDPNFVKKAAEVLQARIEHKTWFEVKQAHSTREAALAYDRVYRDILRVTEALAKERGWDLVVFRDPYEPISTNPLELRDQFRSRYILYANPANDVSQLVYDRLNAEYRAKPRQPELYVP